MITLETIQDWRRSGIAMAVVDDRLRVTGPPDRMTTDLQAKIRANKVEIIRLMETIVPDVASEYDAWTDAELIELWQERSAIMEHDGGLSRQNADQVSKQWIIGLIGEKRFVRFAPNARSASETTTDMPENLSD